MNNLNQILNREDQSHKGQNGKIAIIGGSKDFTGAPSLSAKAALRTGADLTKIYTSEKTADTVSSYSENFIVRKYKGNYFTQENVRKALKLAEWSDVTVIGPGLSQPSSKALQKFAKQTKTPLIIDAEAIKHTIETAKNAIFTPHTKEAEIIKEKHGSIKNFASQTNNTVIVTSKTDKIYSKDKMETCSRGTPAMTVGGTGDILTGIIAGLISQGARKKEAAYYGVHINGIAGEKAAQEKGNGLIPQDIIEKIPETIQEQI